MFIKLDNPNIIEVDAKANVANLDGNAYIDQVLAKLV